MTFITYCSAEETLQHNIKIIQLQKGSWKNFYGQAKKYHQKTKLFFLFVLFSFLIYYLTSSPVDVAKHIEIRVYDEGITAIFDYRLPITYKNFSYNDTNFNYDGSTIYVIRLENAKQNFDINKFNISYSENFYSLKRHQRFYNSKSYKINYQDQSFKDYLHYTGIRVPYDNMNRANP
ncbi:hypothetical protein [Holdemania sp. Marseille-P2844]|uniref:hypothetical protein n=1 Tax=Holdemania sp. Marseille-P2844 TaxID=1852366 RepID=UPI000AD5F450|nr:hypothetical protein [Holdemania sp. Marseille-P2844]